MTLPAAGLPRINVRYWAAITLASIAGANMGDLFAHQFGLGHVNGLPILAAALALILWRQARAPAEAWYWAAILVLRTAATNLGDLATHDLHLGAGAATAALAVPMAGLAWHAARGRTVYEIPAGDTIYWVTMLLAGTLGTVAGDGCADVAGLLPSSALWLAIWAAGLAFVLSRPRGVLAYWTVVAVVRTLGTNLGDLFAFRRGLHLGLPLSTALTLSALVAALTLSRRHNTAASA
jgi:uncharacterized membrane-anchored protein